MEEDMMVSPAYVKKMIGVRGDEDDDAGNRYTQVYRPSLTVFYRMSSSNNAVSSGSSKLPGYSM